MKLKAVLRSSIHIHDVVFRVFPSSTEQEDPEYWGIALSFLAVIVYILPEWKKKLYEESCEVLDEWTLFAGDPGRPAV